MSQIGKILLYVALVGGLVAVGFGYLVIQRHSNDLVVLNQTKADVAAAKQSAVKANQATAVAEDATKQAQSQLTDVQSKVTDLTSQLAAAQSKQTDLQAAVQQSADTAKKAQDELTRISGVLKGSSPDEVMANIDKLNSQVAADNAEQKILQDQLQAANKQVADLKVAVNASKTGTMAPGISGRVTFVNTTWNFVVLNVGLSNGIVPNGELIVYRGRTFIGKVKVTSAEDNTAVADILPGAKADIQVGDDVLN
jgi:predicted RNase H-like nuclease (RuvC/YqgF family)